VVAVTRWSHVQLNSFLRFIFSGSTLFPLFTGYLLRGVAFKGLVPAFDWATYLKGIGAPAVPLYEVSAPEYFRALNKLLVTEDLATWKIYLRWRLLKAAAPSLGNAWRNANSEFTQALTGVKAQPPAWRRLHNGGGSVSG
jgi:predicted metalloendopeptidase